MPNDNLSRLKEEYEESLFRLAMAEYAEERGKEFLSDNEALMAAGEFAPTEEGIRAFDKAMNKAFAGKRLSGLRHGAGKVLRRAAAVAAVAVVSFSLLAFAVEAVRTPVLRFLTNLQEGYGVIGSPAEYSGGVLLANCYAPSFIPKGYVIDKLENRDKVLMVSYTNKKGGYIGFDTCPAGGAITSTETANLVEPVTIHGVAGTHIEDGGITTLLWTLDGTDIAVSSNNPYEVVWQIAESVRYVSGSFGGMPLDGGYLPAYVPKGYSTSFFSDSLDTVHITNKDADGHIIYFLRYTGNAGANVDTENATITPITINGYEGIFIEKDGIYSIVWDIGEYSFYVCSNISKEETLRIAERVRYTGDEPTEPSPAPDYYGKTLAEIPLATGYLPAYIPEGFVVTSFDRKKGEKSIVFAKDDALIHYYEVPLEDQGTLNEDLYQSVTEVQINGYAGCLLKEKSATRVIWEMAGRSFELYAELSDEEILRIAESVRLVAK